MSEFAPLGGHGPKLELGDRVVLMPAAQHILADGLRPNPEGQARLDVALDAWKILTKDNTYPELVDIVVAGHRHKDRIKGEDGKSQLHFDNATLYDANGLYLLEQGVNVQSIHGPEYLKPAELIHNGSGETRILGRASQKVRDEDSTKVTSLYICSPGQARRAELYVGKQEIPDAFIVPAAIASEINQFHETSSLGGKVIEFTLTQLAKLEGPDDPILHSQTVKRMPDSNEGGPGTLPEYLPDFASLPWYRNPATA